MLTTKKVIEDAIRVREKEISEIKSKIEIEKRSKNPYPNSINHYSTEISNFESQITELKQSLQIIYDANSNDFIRKASSSK